LRVSLHINDIFLVAAIALLATAPGMGDQGTPQRIVEERSRLCFSLCLAPVVDTSSSEATRQQMEKLQALPTELHSETLPSDALQLETICRMLLDCGTYFNLQNV